MKFIQIVPLLVATILLSAEVDASSGQSLLRKSESKTSEVNLFQLDKHDEQQDFVDERWAMKLRQVCMVRFSGHWAINAEYANKKRSICVMLDLGGNYTNYDGHDPAAYELTVQRNTDRCQCNFPGKKTYHEANRRNLDTRETLEDTYEAMKDYNDDHPKYYRYTNNCISFVKMMWKRMVNKKSRVKPNWTWMLVSTGLSRKTR
mmetsp:Transcript_2037/g.2120  ORF Transcript_2037/g.2120 Transcript_2037/m.2120 type:complete len:204 (+) Transcript_2037:135-746(+)|eukprot:CAMPEP_0114998958 /NCGR_PEP_ID=MMETSP0216-20121206/15844_1 /TAXON_ID=223996 /ORGANISM="Protocruzia adherens, Strain Boccale" /LENGTH=203 /DNA_ID=CAMNT_0002363709 /DNA_START=65 /DNA_END=676 /DNA_ORIENTATION=+